LVNVQSAENSISQSTIRQILKANNFRAYHIQRVQALTENQKQKRIESCYWGLEILEEDPTFFDNVLFTDESTFQNTEDSS